MNRRKTSTMQVVAFFLLIAGALALLVTAEIWRVIPIDIPFLDSLRHEIYGIYDSDSTQWAAMLISIFYTVFLVYLRRIISPLEWDRSALRVWENTMLVVLVGAGVAYFLDYDSATQSDRVARLLGGTISTDAVVFVSGVAIAQASIVLWGWSSRNRRHEMLSNLVVPILALLGVIFAFVETDLIRDFDFRYRGEKRWSGPWKNPNTFGLFMALALVCTLGSFINTWRKAGSISRKSILVLCSTAAMGTLGYALIKSYSRGAILALAIGWFAIFFYSFRTIERSRWRHQLQSIHWWRWITATGSSMVLLYFACQNQEGGFARRLSSIGQSNDFSQQNRIAAYRGALGILGDHPLTGVGWNNHVALYEGFYCPSRLEDGLAVILNDYFVFGMTLGIPMLVCFIAAVWTVLVSPIPKDPTQERTGLDICCRGAVIVLLVGFWFGGGLFKMALAVPFLILLGLILSWNAASTPPSLDRRA